MLDERSTDWVWRLSATTTNERRLVVVDIDDASLQELGPWPWPRSTLAQLARQLDEQSVGLKMFDMVMPDAREDDPVLTRALAQTERDPATRTPTVLGQVFAIRNESTLNMGQPVGALASQGCGAPSVAAQGVVANVAGLHPMAGHITPALDVDGTVRRVPPLICHEGRRYPALILAGLAAVSQGGQDAGAVDIGVQTPQTWWGPAWTLHLSALPGYPIPVDATGLIRVPYAIDRQAFTAVSAVDVIKGRVPKGLLNGKWVFVAATGFGLSDTIPTPLGGAVNGAEIHLQLMAGILDHAIPYTPLATPALQILMALIGVFALLWLSGGAVLHFRRRTLWLPVAAVCGALLCWVLHVLLLRQANWFIGWAQPALAIVLCGLALSMAEHARAAAVKSRLFRNLASYVSAPVAQRIALTVPSDAIEAQRRDVTILAADIGNFSAYCEARSPEDAARVLHRFYKTASEIVGNHGGVVEEMVGDSLLAVFNGPQPCPDHALSAIRAARDIWLRCGEELPNTLGQGLEPLSIGIGIESGEALMGSFGSSERRVHTVLGQTVTVALRLRDMTADLAYPVLVGAGAAQRAPARIDDPALMLKSLGDFLLPGLRHSMKIHTPRHLLQADGPAERRTLEYLRQQQSTT